MNNPSLSAMPEPQRRNITSVVKDYGRKLFGFIRGKVRSDEDAEDILQDVWYQFSNMTNLDEVESISGWLHQVARNKVTDRYRKKTTDSLEDFEYTDDEGELHIREILSMDVADNADMAMFKEVFWEELMKALDELPENQRHVFVQNELEDKTLQEIADDSGENLKTIISRKGYAIKHLRSRLNYLYQEILN
ncbi:MAG: RNA polymerase sigma factor [Flavobacteriales bacterium]